MPTPVQGGGRRSKLRRPPGVALGVLVGVVMAMGWAPSTVLAHAVLTHSTPHRGESLDQPPPRVQFDFNEPVEVSLGALRVFDSSGDRVDAGEVVRAGGSGTKVAVALRSDLEDGLYTATYRVVSADGHPVSGGFSFAVGEKVAADGGTAPSVAELLEDSETSPVVEGLYGAARGLHYLALLLMVGSLFFSLLIWPAAAGAGRSSPAWPRRLLPASAALGLITASVAIFLQAAVGAAVPLRGLLEAGLLQGLLETRSGQAWALRALAWLAVLALIRGAGRPTGARAGGVAAAVAVIVGSLVWSGHAATQSPQALLIPADLAHVVAGGAWLGGLVLLLVCFWPRRDAVTPGAVQATAAFSRVALPAMVALTATGLLQGWLYVQTVGEVVDSGYGIVLLIKLGLLLLVLALAFGNRRRVRRLSDVLDLSVGRLRAAMRAEVAVAVLVLATTALLVRLAPPAALADVPVERTLDLGPMRLEMVAEPPKAGPVDFHLYLFDRQTGAQIRRVEQLTVELTHPQKRIGPIRLEIPLKGPAHYELLDHPIGVPGDWQMKVTARVSEFDEYTANATVEVHRP